MPLTVEQEREREAVLKLGLSDAESGGRLGITGFNFYYWRRTRGHPPNCPAGRPLGSQGTASEAARRIVYAYGLPDRQAAKALGITIAAYSAWRQNRLLMLQPGRTILGGRKPNLSKRENKKRRRMLEAGLTFSEIARACGVTHQAIWMWAVKRGLHSARRRSRK